MADLDPIEIDINMRQNVSEESDKASQGIVAIGEAAAKATKEIQAQIEQQMAVISKMSKSLEELEKKSSIDSPSLDPTLMDATLGHIQNLKKLLAEAREELSQMQTDTGSLSSTVSMLVGQYESIGEAIQKMSADGKAGADSIRALETEQSLLIDSIGTVGVESEKAISKIADIGVTSRDVFAQSKKDVQDQTETVKFLKKELDTAQKNYTDAAPGKLKENAYKELEAVRKEYAASVVELDKLKIKSDELAGSSRTLVSQMNLVRDEMTKLRLAGRENSDEYTNLKNVYTSLAEQVNAVKIDNKIGSGIKGTLEGITGLSGVLTAGSGVLGLFNQRSEDLQKIQTRLQSLMSITIGLQQVSNLANKQAAFYVVGVTKAKQLWASAIGILNTQLGLSIGLSKGLALGGIGLLMAAIAAIVFVYKEWNAKQEEATRLMQEQRKFQAEVNATTREQATRVEMLEKILKDSNNTYDQRNKALNELKSIMPEYNAMLSKEGVLINDNTGALARYVEQLKNTARAKAAMDKLVTAENTLEERKTSIMTPDQLKLYDIKGEEIFNNKKFTDEDRFLWALFHSQLEKEEADVKLWAKKVEGFTKDNIDEIVENTKAYWELKQQQASTALSLMTPEDKGSKKWNTAQDAYDLATNKLKIWDIKGQHKADAKAAKAEETEAQKKAKKEKEANDKLEKKAYDYQKRIDAARVAAMQDGADQQRAAVKAEYDQTKAYIAQELKDIAELEAVTGKPATVERTRLNDLNTAAAAQFESDTDKINTVAKKVLDDIFADVNFKFKSELDNNLDTINSYYDDTIKEARKAGATITEINELNAARDKEIELAKNESRIESIQFEAEIAERRMAISNKFYVFEADKLKEQLTMQQEAAQKRLDLLNKQYAKTPTDELANEIKLATVEVDEMGAAMKKLPAQKFGEIAAMVSNIAGGLGDLFGEDSSLGKAAGWISDLGSAAADIATGTPQGIISGVLKTANVVKSVIATNKQANKEIKEFRDNLANMAVEYSITLINALKDIEGVNDSLFNKDISNTLTRGMEGYNAAIAKQGELMAQLGNVTIKTGVKKKKFLGITTGTKDIYSSLLKTYPDLIKADGELNRELADTLLQSGNLSKEATNLVNNIIKAADAAEAAMEQVNSMLESVAGSIGDDLRNALTDAFRNGTSEAQTFGKAVSKILEDLVSQMVFSAVFGEKLKELEDRMKESYSPGGDQDLTDDIAWFYKTYGTDVSKFNEALQAAKDAAAKEGIDLFSNSNRTGASAPGLATASQESISELTGGIYAVRQTLGDIRNMQAEELLIKQTISNQMLRLIENTEFCRYLKDIDESLRAMKRNVNVKMV